MLKIPGKPIQIAVASDSENGEQVYLLTDDGKLYTLRHKRYYQEVITKKIPEGNSSSGVRQFFVPYWDEIEMNLEIVDPRPEWETYP